MKHLPAWLPPSAIPFMNFPFAWWRLFESSPLVVPTEGEGPEVTAASDGLQRWQGAGTQPHDGCLPLLFSGPAGPPSSCTLFSPAQGLLRAGTWELAVRAIAPSTLARLLGVVCG